MFRLARPLPYAVAGALALGALAAAPAPADPAASVAAGSPAAVSSRSTSHPTSSANRAGVVRFATFNVSMFRTERGELARDLADARDEPQDREVRNVAEIIQRQRPDVLLLNEFDVDARGVALRRFQRTFLGQGQRGAAPIRYRHAMVFDSNTGVASGFDLDNDGVVGRRGRAYGDDAFGFGEFPGQYGFAILSRYPIHERQVRTFAEFRWADMPGARLPDNPSTPEPADWFTPAELDVVRLSSKNHVDVPIRVGRRVVHVLASHPTPPGFDGPEDRNGSRNADEIRFWADYVSSGRRHDYMYDDRGRYGGLRAGARFVVMGDLNADPADDGNGVPGAADQIVEHPRVRDLEPSSRGAVQASRRQGEANRTHRGDPAQDTADFADAAGSPGNLRVDHVLPSTSLRAVAQGVFWPRLQEPLSRLTGVYDPSYTNGFPSSDHRMVWADLRLPGRRSQ